MTVKVELWNNGLEGRSDDIDREKIIVKKHGEEKTWIVSGDSIGCGDGIKRGRGKGGEESDGVTKKTVLTSGVFPE